MGATMRTLLASRLIAMSSLSREIFVSLVPAAGTTS
jgi:hypothetical protein